MSANKTITPELLDQYGQEGWEMCGVAPAPVFGNSTMLTYYFKRQKQP